MARVTAIELTYNRLYLVESAGVRVLVDAGPDYAGAWESLQDQLAGRIPDAVVATHAHSDHSGLAKRWQEAGVRVWVHDDDERIVSGHPLASDAEFDGFERYLETSGAPETLRAEALAGLRQRREWARVAATATEHPLSRPGGRWPTGLLMHPFRSDSEAERAIAGSGLEIIHCPGHTPGNVVLVHREHGWLFSGDQLLPNITPTPGIQMTPSPGGTWNRFRSLPHYVKSLRNLGDLGLRHCYPGHGDEIPEPLALVDANLDSIEERGARVADVVRSLPGATAYAVAEALYPRALGRRFWQILATIQGNLDLLEDAGAIRQAEPGLYVTA
jgi:glyoxylase-like metal-dependent hydrolase (beta-lactamase superfamily II)